MSATAKSPAPAPPTAPLVISIQSQVVHGHVGNSAALFPMQAAGLEVAAIPTVLFSNTPDYPTLRGAALPADLFADLLRGAEERGLPQRATWLLTGYIGSVEVAELLAGFVARCKAANPALRYLCDPVMGDHGPGLYVPEAIAGVIRDRLLPLADLATPNSFELACLAGHDIARLEDLLPAVAALRLMPGARIIATGCMLAETPAGQMESLVVTQGDGAATIGRHPTPHLPIALAGTGDLFAALLVAFLARGRDLPAAIDLAQRLTGQALAHAGRVGAREILLSDPGFRRALLDP